MWDLGDLKVSAGFPAVEARSRRSQESAADRRWTDLRLEGLFQESHSAGSRDVNFKSDLKESVATLLARMGTHIVFFAGSAMAPGTIQPLA
jgi:hypothetical protein